MIGLSGKVLAQSLLLDNIPIIVDKPLYIGVSWVEHGGHDWGGYWLFGPNL